MTKVPHLEIVKESLGQEVIEVLTAIFKAAKNEPPSVPAKRFRADNPSWLGILDNLERKHSLIERSGDYSNYLVKCYALPLIEVDRAQLLLGFMEKIYQRFRELYPIHLNDALSIEVLLGDLNDSEIDEIEALYYLSGCHDVWSGKSINFPYSDNSTLVISESVLRRDSIKNILGEYFEWNFINPKNESISLLQDLLKGGEDISEGFFASRNVTHMPEWFDHLDDVKRALIGEINFAMQNDLSALPTVGLRTLIETVMVEKIGDGGGFKAKLERFERNGHATKNQVYLLEKVLDAGNASAHRAYFPNKEDIRTCVDVVQHLLLGIYILEPQVKKLSSNTPDRTKQEKK